MFAPPFESIASVNVATPEFTTNPPELILTPVLAVTIPIESTFVLSSLVNVPATETFPVNVAFPTMESVVPSKVNLLVSSNSPPVPAITIRLSVKSVTLAVANVEAPDTFTSSSSVCPLTSNPVSVPNDVILGCAAVCNVPVKVDAVTPAIPVMFVALSPTIFPFAFIFPETVTALRVPSDVILGCAAV